MAKPPVPQKKPRSTARTLLTVGLCALAVSLGLTILFVNMNRHVMQTTGKVVDTFTQKSVVSRRQTVDQEYLVIGYNVNGKDYSGKALSPKKSYSFGQKFVPVYYYPAAPQFAWFFHKSNPSMLICITLVALSAGLVVLTWSEAKKARVAAAAARTSKVDGKSSLKGKKA